MRAALACLSLAALLGAQERIPLDGTWQLAAEPRDAANTYPHEVQVPAAFETALGDSFDGVAWYRRTLPLRPDCRGARIRVEFAAAATHATVFCNGREVGQHLGGWTPFRVDVTDALQWHDDVLEVRLDERVGHNTQGFLPIIQPHFGGLWQSVTLCVDRGPVIDEPRSLLFGRLQRERGVGVLQARICLLPLPGQPTAPLRVTVQVLDGARAVASATWEVDAGGIAAGNLELAAPRAWSPQVPNLYRARIEVRAGDAVVAATERRVGFRELQADGSTIRWNGDRLVVRGLLHWGYCPPQLAPPTDREFWRRQLEDWRSLGFNTLKCCLWVPPRCVYELCDELGLLVWQEYPTWHPQMDQAHKQELLTEYGEFFAHDGSHPSVAFRSLTCETGHGADLDVVKALYDACKAAVPDTLVVDDSSWIGWQRITDFWDEHPYGNNRWWPGRLAEFERHIAEHGKKPLLLGECIAADTWADRQAWLAAHGEAKHWWQPACLLDQARFEAWVEQEFGRATLASLGPISRDYAMRTRRYQIERLRRSLPDAGYVVSVARDFQKARMGLRDDFDRLKWSAAEWAWQGDTMACLDTPDDRRAFVTSGTELPIAVRIVQAGPARSVPCPAPATADRSLPVAFAQGVSPPLPVTGLPRSVAQPTRVSVPAPIGDSVTAARQLGWSIWLLPPFDDARPAGVAVVEQLDVATLDLLEQGGRVYLHAHGQKHSPRSEGKWYLTGAPFAPPHPLHARLPADLLLELQPFDLDGGRVLPWSPWLGQVDPILAFWETHDIAEVRAHLFAFDCNVGRGRLLVSAFDDDTDAGRYVEHEFLRHLASGPAPGRSLTAATIAGLRATLTEKKLDLPVWRFRTDPDDRGRQAGWHQPTTDVGNGDWRDLKAGSHWENQGDDLKQYTGIAWYRIDVDVPADWRGLDARAVFEGVDDSFELWLNGESLGTRGDPATGTTIWLERQVLELGQRLQAGARNTLALRVVDHGGAGGLWKPAFLTTGPADARSLLLH